MLALAEQGVFNVGRRELRYLLETTTKHVFVDQQLPGEAPLRERLDYLHSNVPRSSIDVIDDVVLAMVDQQDDFRNEIKSIFGQLSGYIHPSRRQFEERLQRAAKGEFSGFESARVLRGFSRIAFKTYDLVLALTFEGVGPSFTGDIFTKVLDEDPDWKFYKGPYVAAVSRFFNYKLERGNDEN